MNSQLSIDGELRGNCGFPFMSYSKVKNAGIIHSVNIFLTLRSSLKKVISEYFSWNIF